MILVAVSTVGVKNSKAAVEVFKAGMAEALRVIKPQMVLCYGGDIGFEFKDTPVKHYRNEVTEAMRDGR